MNRRGFIGRMMAAMSAPVAAKAVAALPAIQPTPPEEAMPAMVAEEITYQRVTIDDCTACTMGSYGGELGVTK